MKQGILVCAFIALFCALITPRANADEPIRSRAELLRKGYRPASQFKQHYPVKRFINLRILSGRKNVLPWPVEFLDKTEPIGNDMIQFQDYGYPYYHGGCDLISKDGRWVTTPVSGYLEGGHYSYTGNPDGSMTKYWIPWPGTGEYPYFELAIITDEGLRFEFHHVDRNSLPPETVAALDKGHVRIEAGTKLGKVYDWGASYDHIHYNIVTPEGLRINPEFVSEKFPDNQAPEIQGVYAIDEKDGVHDFKGGKLDFRPKEFVVAGFDRMNSKSAFKHPFPSTLLKFTNGSVTGWDYRTMLKTMDGHWPAIFEYYMPKLRTPSGEHLETFGDYGDGFNLVRLQVPSGATGEFEIEVSDMAGNQKTLKGEM